MARDIIGWGIAATGGIAAKFATDFRRLDRDSGGAGGELVAVGSRHPDTAAAFAAEHGIERHHGSHADLAADPDVDVVYVASLQNFHAEHVVQYLEAGKHVLVEKPIAMNVREVDAMTAAAAANDRFLMEAMWTRFNPAHVDAMARIAAGEIGEVRRVRADFSLGLGFDPDHRLWSKAKGGGAMLDLGVYPLTIAWWALGPPATVHHVGHVASTGVDDELMLQLGWANGAAAQLSCALGVQGPVTARVEGVDGAVDFPLPLHACDRFTLTRRDGTSDTFEHESAGLHHQVREVHQNLAAGRTESERMPWATSRAMIAFFDAIRADLGVTYPNDSTG